MFISIFSNQFRFFLANILEGGGVGIAPVVGESPVVSTESVVVRISSEITRIVVVVIAVVKARSTNADGQTKVGLRVSLSLSLSLGLSLSLALLNLMDFFILKR